jgi:hypothetical protein
MVEMPDLNNAELEHLPLNKGIYLLFKQFKV